MKTFISTIMLTAALAFSSVANAGFVSYSLTDAMSNDIRNNGAYTLQTVNNDLSIEYWLYDQLAMLRFSAESINYVFYTPFVDPADNELVKVNYSRDDVFDGFFTDFSAYEFNTFENVNYIDYVFQIDDNYSFTGLDFDSKNVFQDSVFANNYETMYYDNFKAAALEFDLVDNPTNVPEPSSLAIFALAGLGMTAGMRKRRASKA